jgi:hypothetical protein
MNIISVKQRTKGVSKEEQEKLDILARDFRKLDENLKDYILELSRKLADIHCGVGFSGEYNENDLAHGEISGIIRLEPV